jgi:hypothetical protein
MSAQEVLHSFPSQRKVLLSALGAAEPTNLGSIFFDTSNVKPHFPYNVTFQIVVFYTMKLLTHNIFCTMVDEGASTCVMSLACWKAIGKPKLSLLPTFLTVFDDFSFRPHGIILSFPMQLEGKTLCVEVEVVDVPLDYNLVLGQSWNLRNDFDCILYFLCILISS